LNCPEIWIFGCSFAWGEGVDDDETFPWLIAEQLPAFSVVNFAGPGYGTTHALIRLREALEEENRAVIAVLAHGSFHGERNVLSPQWRWIMNLSLSAEGVWGPPIAYPAARLSTDGKLVLEEQFLGGIWSGLVGKSAFLNTIRLWLVLKSPAMARSRSEAPIVSRALLKEFAEQCSRHGVTCLIAGLIQDEVTREDLAFCERIGVPALDISVTLRARLC